MSIENIDLPIIKSPELNQHKSNYNKEHEIELINEIIKNKEHSSKHNKEHEIELINEIIKNKEPNFDRYYLVVSIALMLTCLTCNPFIGFVIICATYNTGDHDTLKSRRMLKIVSFTLFSFWLLTIILILVLALVESIINNKEETPE